MEGNTFILDYFIQFTCTNLDRSWKEGGNCLNLLQKEEGTQKRAFSQKRGEVPTLGETMFRLFGTKEFV